VRPRILVTPGDPRGIGPEVALKALETLEPEVADDLDLLGPDGPLAPPALLELADRARSEPFDDATAGRVAGASIERAVERALAGDARAIVTGPLHKPSLRAAGWDVPGQTELLRDLSRASSVGMLMAAERTRLGGPLRVLLATTHLPLRAVPDAVTVGLLVEQMSLLHDTLRSDWGIAEPRLGLCGLNPHASDGGLFGSEEADVFAPALERVRVAGVDASGPWPADTVFTRALGGDFDAVVSPYHDVGMAAFKTVSFGAGVNVSIGLPFVRTSPDHGTAFDLAGTGRASADSMVEAIRMARKLSKNRFDKDLAVV